MACTNLHLIDFSEEDDNLIAVPFRDLLQDLRISLTFDNVRPESLKPKRPSLDWDDTAFFTTEGLLNPEELCKVNKGFKKAESKQPSSWTPKDVQTRRVDSTVKSVGDPSSRSLNPKGSKGMPRTRTKDQQLTYSTEKNSNGYRLDELSSSASSAKCVGWKINPRNMKPTTSPKSVLSPSSSTRSSSSLSPASHFDNAISTTDFQSPLQVVCQNFNERKLISRRYATKSSIRNIKSSGLKMPSPRLGFFDEQPLKPTTSPKSVLSPLSSTRSSSSLSPASRFNNAISTTDFQSPLQVVCQNFNERKLTSSRYATRSSIRNVKASGLKMPSPRLGFFDEQPLQPFNLSPVTTENRPKVRKASASCTKPKLDGETQTGISRNRLNIERKFQKNDNIESNKMSGIKEKRHESYRRSFQKSRKENKQCSFQKNDKIDSSDVTDVRGQQSCLRPDQLSIPPTSEHTTTPCSRTPLAEKMLLTSDNVNNGDCIKLFKGANSHVQSEPVEPRRLSFCRKSLEWDSAFFSNAGLLNAEELFLVNRGFRAVERDQPSSRTTKHMRRHTIAGWNQTTLDGNGFHGKTLKGNVFKNPDSHPSPVMKTNPEQSQKPHYKTRSKLTTQRFKRST